MRGSFAELMVVAIVAALMILFFGAKKLPELAKSFSESRKIIKDDAKEVEEMEASSEIESEVVETVEAKEVEEASINA